MWGVGLDCSFGVRLWIVFVLGGPLEEEPLLGVYMDDTCGIALDPCHPHNLVMLRLVGLLAKHADATNLRESWPRFEAKDQNGLPDGKMRGYNLDWNQGIVSISRELRM